MSYVSTSSGENCFPRAFRITHSPRIYEAFADQANTPAHSNENILEVSQIYIFFSLYD